MRLAVIDCGTHSIRLLISDFDPARPEIPPQEILRRTQIVGLGQGVDRTGQLAPEALTRTFAAVEDYAARIRQAEVDRVRMVATSASRDAENFFEFATGVEARLGTSPAVISGREEATLGFSGAVALHPELGSPALVLDIGGGSTEFSFGSTNQAKPTLLASASMNMGSTRVTERYLRPSEDSRGVPSREAVAAAEAFIDGLITEAAETVPLAEARELIGVAGSVTTLTALGLGLETYDPARINGAVLSSSEHRKRARELVFMTRAQKAALGPMHPKRVDQIAGGVLVWERVLAYLESQPSPDSGDAPRGSFPVRTSENDILDGLMLALADASRLA